jgi:hypothetical protein
VSAEKEDLIRKLAKKYDVVQLHQMLEGEYTAMRQAPSVMPFERGPHPASYCPEHPAITEEFEKHAAALGYPDRRAV